MADDNLNSPSLPWRRRILLSLVSFFVDWVILRPNGGLNCTVLRLLDFSTPSGFQLFPDGDGYFTDFVVKEKTSLWFRLFVPFVHAKKSLPVLIFFHGGGFLTLSPSTYLYVDFCRRLASLIPAIVVSVNYSLAPDHRLPTQYEEGFDVLCFLDKLHEYVLPANADVSRCFLSGDSAGANLAHQVVLRFARQKPKFTSLNLAGLISIQPFFGGEERTESEMRLDPGILVTLSRTDTLWKAFLPEKSNRDHPAVNVTGPNAENITEVNFPAIMVVVGGLDPLQDWQRRYFRWLERSGKRAELIEYPNMIHAFYLFPELPQSSQMLEKIKDFIHQCLSS